MLLDLAARLQVPVLNTFPSGQMNHALAWVRHQPPASTMLVLDDAIAADFSGESYLAMHYLHATIYIHSKIRIAFLISYHIFVRIEYRF